jgi:hypothetical protein
MAGWKPLGALSDQLGGGSLPPLHPARMFGRNVTVELIKLPVGKTRGIAPPCLMRFNMPQRYGRCRRGQHLRVGVPIPHGHWKTRIFVGAPTTRGFIAL